jgi:hypothetical protein
MVMTDGADVWTHEANNDHYLTNTRRDGVTARAVMDPGTRYHDGRRAYWRVWAFCAIPDHAPKHFRQGQSTLIDEERQTTLDKAFAQMLEVSREAAKCLAKHPGTPIG